MNEALAELDLFGWLGRFGIVAFRTSGLMVFLPIYGSPLVPARIRMALAIVLAVVLLPLVSDGLVVPTTTAGWVLAGVRELSVGFALGLAAKAMFAGVEAASVVVSGQSGFSLANMFDPMTGEQVLSPAMLQNLLATSLFLAADLHHLLLLALGRSYELLPPAGALPDVSSLGEAAAMLGARMFGVAVELAAPALLVTFSMDLLLALVGRAMTQVPILLVGYPIKLAAGLIALALLAVGTGSAIGWIGRTLTSDGMMIVAAMAGGR